MPHTDSVDIWMMMTAKLAANVLATTPGVGLLMIVYILDKATPRHLHIAYSRKILYLLSIINRCYCHQDKPIRTQSLAADAEGCRCYLFPMHIDWPHVSPFPRQRSVLLTPFLLLQLLPSRSKRFLNGRFTPEQSVPYCPQNIHSIRFQYTDNGCL